MDELDIEIARTRALHAIACGLARLKWLRDAERLTLAMIRHDRALKANFNPQQLRVPKKQPGAGQWTRGGGASANNLPEIPKQRPPTPAECTAVLKRIARRLGPLITIGEALYGAASWIHEYHAKIDSYRDPPKSFEELRDAVSPESKAGYQDHHVVEQKSAEVDGKYGRELIDHPDNIVRIPTMKHEDINAWYQRSNELTGRMPPREYLRDKSWDERREVGLRALREVGVLKP